MIRLLAIAAILAGLWGCSHAPATSPPGYLLPSATGAAHSPLTIKVHLASYLNRGGIVMQLSDSEIQVGRHHRWAEPLATQLQRALEARMSSGDEKTLTVELTRFQGLQGKDRDSAVITGRWALTGNNGEATQGCIQWEAALDSGGYANLVRTLDQGWQAVAAEIATAMD